MSDYDIRDFGAAGDGTQMDTEAVQAAIDACHQAGGGRVIVSSPGTYRCGAIELKSDVELHLQSGATLLSSDRPEDMRQRQFGEATPMMFLWADGAERIAITGQGTIDGNGRNWMGELGRYIHRPKPGQRPVTIFLMHCRLVDCRGFTIHDNANWSLRLSDCDDVVVHGLRIDGDRRTPNGDGIDPDHSRNVRISDCHLVCGDDCICIKARKEFADSGPCENVVVTNCILESCSCALMVGIEATAAMRNILFDNCIVRSSNRGLAIHLADPCDVDNIVFSNILVETRYFHTRWWGAGEPIYITAHPEHPERPIGTVRGVRFSNVRCRSENGIIVSGTAARNIRDITFDHVDITLARWTSWATGRRDLRPLPGPPPANPEHGCAGLEMDTPVPAFLLENAADITLRHCRVRWDDPDDPAFTHALEAHGIDGLILHDFRATAARPDLPAVVLHGCRDVQGAPDDNA